MIIHSDAGVGKFERKGRKTVEAAIAFHTSDGTLFYEKIENFNTTYAKSTSNTAELLASLKAFEKYQDKLDEIVLYTDCDILPLAKNHYLTHLNSKYVDPFLLIKNVAIENHLESKLDLLMKAIEKVKIVKVKGHTKGMENSYIDDVCYKVLNNEEPLSFDEYVNLTKFTIFSDVSFNESNKAYINHIHVENDNFIHEKDKKATAELLDKMNVSVAPKSIREKRIFHKYISEEKNQEKANSLSLSTN